MKKIYGIIGVIVLIAIVIALSILKNNNGTTATSVKKIYQASELFTEMHWKTIYDHVEIDDKYTVTVYQKDGDINSANDLSTGGTLTLALAFTLALNSLSGFDLPIVIDTPMGNLDEDIQMNIAEFLPNYSKDKQITLLVKSKEYTKEFRSAVYDYVGEEYKLEFDEEQKGITRVKPWS